MRVYEKPDELFRHGPAFRVLSDREVDTIIHRAWRVYEAGKGIMPVGPDDYLISAMAEEIHFLQEQLRG
jgi:hypothetical protein